MVNSSEKNLLDVINNVPGGICAFDLTDNFPYINFIVWNRFMEEITGYNKEEINKTGICEICSIKQERESIIKAFSYPDKTETLFKIRNKAGADRLLKFKFSVINNENNQETYTALVTDIAESKDLEQEIIKIRENEAMLKKVTENTLDMIAILNPDFSIKYLSPSHAYVLGYASEQLSRIKIINLVYPEEKYNIIAFLKNLKRLKETVKCQFRVLCADGNCKYFETLGKPLYNNGLLDGYILSSRDVTVRVKTEQDLKKSRKRYRTLFNNVNDAIYLNKLDKDGRPSRYVEINDVGCLRLGYSRDELKSMTIYDITPDLTEEKVSCLLDTIYKKGNALYEANPRTKDGKTVPVEINSIILNLNNEKFILSISRNITERKEMERAEEYEKLRTEFFANISHELRTPVNVIFSALQLVDSHKNDKLCDDIFNKYIPILRQNCYRLLRLINNLIDVTKIDAGYLHLNLSNENIVSLVENITLSVAQYIEFRGITLVFDTDVEEKIMACDIDKIERIMLNLISNAVKFTKAGGSIFVNMMDKEDKVIISVKDTGIGIARENLNLVFDRFIQVDKSFARKREGSGIGLSLVKSLVEMHNGTIEVKSELNKGSEFIITLPVQLIPVKNENLNSNEYLFQDNVEKINIEFSDIYSSQDIYDTDK